MYTYTYIHTYKWCHCKQMYKIISPPGYHGTLGRRIQAEINCDRGKRNLNATVKQYTAKGIVKPKVNVCFKSKLFDYKIILYTSGRIV